MASRTALDPERRFGWPVASAEGRGGLAGERGHVTIAGSLPDGRVETGSVRGRAVSPLEVPDREAWRAWLAANHASATEVWLVYRKGAAKGKGSMGYEESVEEALCFGWIDGLVRRIDDDRYMRRFTPRKPKSRWSASNKARLARLLADGRMAPPGRRVVEAARKNGSWDEVPDANKDWAMPPELRCALDQDPEANAAFESLSPSHRRQYVSWVASAKRETTRERRAERATEMLRRGDRFI